MTELMIEQLKIREHLFVPYAKATKHPYLVCDRDTFDDQVYLFFNAEKVKQFIAKMDCPMFAVDIPVENRLFFFGEIHSLGVNQVVIDGCKESPIAMEEIVHVESSSHTDYPVIFNTSLQLTACYFLQELQKKVEQRDQKQLALLEQEISVNLERGTYLLPVRKMESGWMPCLLREEDSIYLPLFTDEPEIKRYLDDENSQIMIVTFPQLSTYLVEEIDGFCVNPGGVRLKINKEALQAVLEEHESN